MPVMQDCVSLAVHIGIEDFKHTIVQVKDSSVEVMKIA